MDWKYVKKLEQASLAKVEEKLNIKLPSAFKNIITNYNAGKPTNNLFDSTKRKEYTLKHLLSFNESDKENIYMCSDLFTSYIPFGVTDFGDVVCMDKIDFKIYLYNHEQDNFEFICSSISEFISSLY